MKDGARIDASIAVPFIIFTLVWSSTWIVIRDQLGVVPPQWSVAYRFAIAAVAMALVALWGGHSLKIDRGGLIAATVIGVTQFCVNFNSVYIAERFITSGVVATVFALLLIPNSLLAWAFLGQKPNRRFVAAGPRGRRRQRYRRRSAWCAVWRGQTGRSMRRAIRHCPTT